MFDVFSAIIGLTVAASSPTSLQQIPLDQWQPAYGDTFIADTRSNIGYLVHADGTYATTRIGSGRREVVHYMRITYNASTPSDDWNVGEIDTQTDRQTFGKDGTFMRLYRDGTDRTSYGIHSVGNINELLAADDRYKSMGCVLVSDEVLAILLETYKLNDNSLAVLTVDGLVAPMTPSIAPKSIATK